MKAARYLLGAFGLCLWDAMQAGLSGKEIS
jgi:hypothetical protein